MHRVQSTAAIAALLAATSGAVAPGAAARAETTIDLGGTSEAVVRAETAIDVSATPVSSGPSRGVRAVTIIDRAGKELVGYSASYALVVGVSTYTAGWDSLPGVQDDIAEVTKALQTQGFEVTTVRDPSSRVLRDTYFDFVFDHGYDYDTRLLFYFAGHGHTGKLPDGRPVGYIVPSDAPLPQNADGSDRTDFRRKALSMEYFGVLARIIEAKHALFVFDSCFAGTVFGINRGDAPGYVKADLQKPIRYFISAGDKNQKVPDRSLFRKFFVKAMNGAADQNGDGIFLADELGSYLRNKVAYFSKDAETPVAGPLRDPELSDGRYVFGLGNQARRSEGEVPQARSIDSYNSGANMALGKLLRRMDELAHLYGERGPAYRQHAWAQATEAENVKMGVDTSRAIWLAFRRAGLEYNANDSYVTSAEMVGPDSRMTEKFVPCSADDLKTGDVVVYRDAYKGDGHVVIVIDPVSRIAWGSMGWDASGRAGSPPRTGIVYQQIKYRKDWSVWDRSTMKFAACWRHGTFVE